MAAMAAATAAASTLPTACTFIQSRGSAHQRAHASGPASTSGGFTYAQAVCPKRASKQNSNSKRDLNCWMFSPLKKNIDISLSRNRLLNYAELQHANVRGECQRCPALKVRAASGGLLDRPGVGGTGVLEKPPALDTSWLEKLYQTDTGGEGSKEKEKKRSGGGDQYRVLLVDSPKHTEKRVINVLPKVVPNVSSDAARGIFEESKVKGFGIVIVCVKEYAETYCQLLIRNGLSSRVEPDQDTI